MVSVIVTLSYQVIPGLLIYETVLVNNQHDHSLLKPYLCSWEYYYSIDILLFVLFTARLGPFSRSM